MSDTKVLLGKIRNDADVLCAGENLYLTKHSWDCGWYWGLGYIGNKSCHFHFESLLYNVVCGDKTVQWPMPKDLFESTNLTEKDWWLIRDLFVQAYALRAAAAVYRHGGHNSSKVGLTDVIKNSDKAAVLNADLQTVLDALWEFVTKAVELKAAA